MMIRNENTKIAYQTSSLSACCSWITDVWVPSNHIHSKPLPQLTEFLPQALCYEFERTQETPNDS